MFFFFFFFFGFRCEDLRLRLRDPFEDAPEVTPGSGWEWGEGVGLVALVPCGQCYEFFFSSSAVSHRCRFVWFLLMLSEIEGKEKRVQPERTRATKGEDGQIWWCQIFGRGWSHWSEWFVPAVVIHLMLFCAASHWASDEMKHGDEGILSCTTIFTSHKEIDLSAMKA